MPYYSEGRVPFGEGREKWKERRRWGACNPEKIRKLFKILAYGSKTFGQLLKETGWGRETLNSYLENLKEDDKGNAIIEKEKPSSPYGRYSLYTLIRSHPFVAQVLKWKRPHHKIKLKGRLHLERLGEEQFVTDWLNTIKFCLLNILQDSIHLGKVKNPDVICNILENHMSDLKDTVLFYSKLMAERIRLKTLDPEKIWDEHDKLYNQIKRYEVKLLLNK